MQLFTSVVIFLFLTGLSSIYISRVAPNSAADKCGLSPGDQILSANYVSFLENISVKRAYEVLHSNGSHSVLLTFLPRREAFAPRQRRHHCFSWIDPEGRSVSPPPPDRELVDIPGEVSAVDSVVESRQLERTFRRAPRLKDLHRASASTHAPFHRKSSLSGGVRQVLGYNIHSLLICEQVFYCVSAGYDHS